MASFFPPPSASTRLCLDYWLGLSIIITHNIITQGSTCCWCAEEMQIPTGIIKLDVEGMGTTQTAALMAT